MLMSPARRRTRTQRKSDGTISLQSIRFEIPSHYRHLERVTIWYASWDLGHVILVDEPTDTVLGRIYPVDKARNADGQRRSLEPVAAPIASPFVEYRNGTLQPAKSNRLSVRPRAYLSAWVRTFWGPIVTFLASTIATTIPSIASA